MMPTIEEIEAMRDKLQYTEDVDQLDELVYETHCMLNHIAQWITGMTTPPSSETMTLDNHVAEVRNAIQLLTGINAVLIEDGHSTLAEQLRTAIKDINNHIKAFKKIEAPQPIAYAKAVKDGDLCSISGWVSEEWNGCDLAVYAKPFPDLEWPLVISTERREREGYQLEDLKLDAPARVGGTTFGKGIKWSTVIGCAQRAYNTKPLPAKSRKAIREMLESLHVVPDDAAPDGESK